MFPAAVVVADECGASDGADFKNVFRGSGGGVSLVLALAMLFMVLVRAFVVWGGVTPVPHRLSSSMRS